MSETNNNFCSASTLLELLLAVCLIAIIVVIAIPNRVGSHTCPANTCINNLKQIEAAANQFAWENHLTNGDRINFPNDLTPYIKLNREGRIPPCPSGGIYHITKVGETPTCSLGNTVTPAHVLP